MVSKRAARGRGRGHNYRRKLERLVEEGKIAVAPGTVAHVRVLHDRWCGALTGRDFCTCDVVVEVEHSDGRVERY